MIRTPPPTGLATHEQSADRSSKAEAPPMFSRRSAMSSRYPVALDAPGAMR